MSEENTEKEVRRVSFSQYQVYSTCPKQWKLKYVDGLRDPENIHGIFGTSIHEAIQEWLLKLYDDENPKLAKFWDMEGHFKERLMTNFKDAIKTNDDGSKWYPAEQEQLKEFYLDGMAILEAIRKHRKEYFPDKSFELLGVEIPLEILIRPKIKFVGYIDIVVRDKKTKRVYIYDLKTSTKGWSYEKKDPKKLNQILLYKRHYATQFDMSEEDIFVEFIILKRKMDDTNQWAKRITRFEPSHGVISVNRAVKSFDDFVNTIFDDNGDVILENIKATPFANSCRWCPFKQRKDLCPEGYYD